MESFNLGRTISRTFSLTFGTLATVGLFILVLQVLGVAISFFTQGMMMDQVLDAQAGNDPNAAFAIFGSAAYWVSVLASLVISTLTMGGAVHGYLKSASGEPVSIGDCFSVGLAKLLPLLGLLILWVLGVGIGWILLFVPGVILMCMWSVTVPALIGENRGIIEAFARSRELTKGSRLMIFVTLLIFLVLVYLVMFVLIAALLGGVMGGAIMMPGSAGIKGFGALIAMLPLQWLFAALLNALLVSIYLETVSIKEGGAPDQLGQVFS